MPQDLLNLFDYESRARRVMPGIVFERTDGGAFDEVTFRRIRPALDSILLRPRVLRGVEERDTGTTVLGQRISMPVLAAPEGGHRSVHPEGELASARAVAGAGTIMILAHMANHSLEQVAAECEGPRWFQLYVFPDREFVRECVQRAEEAGYLAIVVTVDYPAERFRDLRPEGDYADFAKEINVRRRFHSTPLGSPNAMRLEPDGVRRLNTQRFDPALTWATIDWIRSITSLPVVLKGVLTGEDARLSLEHGVAGVIVSNHAARLVDGMITSIEALPEVVDAVEGRCEVLIDGGFRRGIDVLKALALGAKAVCIGRPMYYGLSVGGEQAVRHSFEILRGELDHAMAMCGVRTVDDIDRSLVTWPGLAPF